MQTDIKDLYRDVVSGLNQIGYERALLEENYSFPDWFSAHHEERRIAAAAFGQTPVSYESACIGVAVANGVSGHALINGYRALGAPVILEICGESVREWLVSHSANEHKLLQTYPANRISQLFVDRAEDWQPTNFLREKNIGDFRWARQLNLFGGLLPELEERIQESLDPLLRHTLSVTKETYTRSTGRDPQPEQLFKLVFSILTAKVFHDRQLGKFKSLGPDADELLAAVAKHYRTDPPKLLNREAREVAAKSIWSDLDFRNLSVEVLSQIWSETLVDDETKRLLGIHRTSRAIVRYMLSRIPFETTDDERIILEPCCGSAVFLIGAMNHLRPNLFGAPASERHRYFVNHLAGIEKDPFGVEISRLALTLADFPNPNGWNVVQGDVFASDILASYLQRAGVVLCNPPFEKFASNERRADQVSVNKPVELLERVLRDLHPRGVLGIVLPINIISGQGYRAVRRRLAERFASLEFTLLPDSAFDADHEVALLIAKEPIPHNSCRVLIRTVRKDEWTPHSEISHAITSEQTTEKTSDESEKDLMAPELFEIWEFIKTYRKACQCADVFRGIEWSRELTTNHKETGFREVALSPLPKEGYMRGVAPRTKFDVFQTPTTCFLNMQEKFRRGNAHSHPWGEHKVIVNKSRRSRSAWKMASFPDDIGLVCYQTFIALWPHLNCPDIWVLSAIINSPLANAFVSTREGRQDITKEILEQIPMPYLTASEEEKIRSLVKQYRDLINRPILSDIDSAKRVLLEIDAAVLDGYHLPPRLEHQLLEYFRRADRKTPFVFGPYLPEGEDVYFSLSDRLSPKFKESTAKALLRRMAIG